MSLTVLAFFTCVIGYLSTINSPISTKESVAKTCLFMLCLISAFRYIGGTDLYAYKTFYDYALPLNGFSIQETIGIRYEIGYTYLVSLLKTLGISYYGHIFINAVFFYVCLWYGLKNYTKEFGILILVFLYKLFYYNTFISMRQSITVAGFFLLIRFIEEKNWKKYYLYCIPLSLFHNGALLLYLIYPIAYLNITKKRLVWLNIIFIPTLAFNFLGIDLLSPIGSALLMVHMQGDDASEKISGVFDNAASAIGVFHTLEYFLFMYFVVKYYDKIKELPAYKDVCIKLFVVLLPLFTTFRNSEILTREKDYFTLMYAVVIWYLMQINYGRNRYVWIFFTVVWCTYGFLRFTILFDDGDFLNYVSWLSLPGASFFE